MVLGRLEKGSRCRCSVGDSLLPVGRKVFEAAQGERFGTCSVAFRAGALVGAGSSGLCHAPTGPNRRSCSAAFADLLRTCSCPAGFLGKDPTTSGLLRIRFEVAVAVAGLVSLAGCLKKMTVVCRSSGSCLGSVRRIGTYCLELSNHFDRCSAPEDCC